MKYRIIVEINGVDAVYIVEADNEIDAQFDVLHDINKSIQVQSVCPWDEHDEKKES